MCVAVVPLYMAEALTVLLLQGSFRGVVRFHRDSQTAKFGQGTYFRHFGPFAIDTIKFGIGKRALAASWSRRPERSCKTPWAEMPVLLHLSVVIIASISVFFTVAPRWQNLLNFASFGDVSLTGKGYFF